MIPQHFWRKPWSCKKMVSPTYPWQRPSRRNKSQSISQRYKPLAQSIQTGIKVLVFLLLIRVHHRTRNSGLFSNLARTIPAWAFITFLLNRQHSLSRCIKLQSIQTTFGRLTWTFLASSGTHFEGTQSSTFCGISSLYSWRKTGSRPPYPWSRSRLLYYARVSVGSRSYATHRRMYKSRGPIRYLGDSRGSHKKYMLRSLKVGSTSNRGDENFVVGWKTKPCFGVHSPVF